MTNKPDERVTPLEALRPRGIQPSEPWPQPGSQPIPDVKPPSLWQRFKMKLFGGEGTVKDLFR